MPPRPCPGWGNRGSCWYPRSPSQKHRPGLRAEAARVRRPARECAQGQVTATGRAGGHADRSLCEGGVRPGWRRRSEKFRVGPRLRSAVTQVVAGRRRLCGGQEVWLRAPRPHVRPVPWPALEGRPSIFPPLPPNPGGAEDVGRAAQAAVPITVPSPQPGVLVERGGAAGRASAVDPDGKPACASWPSQPAHHPLPLAPSSGIPVTARNKTCQGIVRFKRRKNIPTGDRAALGLREIPDPKNLK